MASMLEKLAKRKEQKEALEAEGNSQGEELSVVSPIAPPKAATAAGTSTAEIIAAQRRDATMDKSARYVDLDLIDVESQVRKDFDEEHIRGLAAEFVADKTNQPKHPINLWDKGDGRFLVDDGENRLRAQKLNRDTLSVANFGTIRATIMGAPPSKLERTQSQLNLNVMRDDLNMAEIALALKAYFEEYPEATQVDAAEWVKFPNLQTGRKKVSEAIKFLEADKDLFEKVHRDELSFSKATKIMKERDREREQEKRQAIKEQAENENPPSVIGSGDDQSELEVIGGSDPVEKKQPSNSKATKLESTKRKVTYSIPEEDAIEIVNILRWFAEHHGLETILTGDKMDRKTFMDIVKNRLPDLADVIT